MAIAFACPVCGKRMSVPDAHAGKVGKCSCGASVRIPPAAPSQVLEGVPVPIDADSLPSCELCGKVVADGGKICRACRDSFGAPASGGGTASPARTTAGRGVGGVVMESSKTCPECASKIDADAKRCP
ncbi:MAG: hypothetical protein K8T20_15120, partial [Planctomycetes bacterium]|nr:hypothetical protein [Planctomycetota bacterium]